MVAVHHEMQGSRIHRRGDRPGASAIGKRLQQRSWIYHQKSCRRRLWSESSDRRAFVKVAVIGATGQLGRDMSDAFASAGHDAFGLGHHDVEISSLESVRNSLEPIRPDIVVNTAAFHHVEKCEAEPGRAFAVNSQGALNVAQITNSLGAKLVHVSTDYVFDGKLTVPYTEQDLPGPLNVYGNTKLSGEFFVRSTNPRHFVVRVSAIYGLHPCRAKGGLNFVELMLKLSKERNELRVVDDEFVSPTPTIEIGRQIVAL